MKDIFKNLMVGDWVADEYGNTTKIEAVDRNFAYADFRCYGGDILRFCKNNPPQPIPLTPEILLKNGFSGREASYSIEAEGRLIRVILSGIHAGISVCDADEIRRYNRCSLFETPTVHRLQHALRLCGLGEMADNFKV